jgi:hypothetical protein
VEEQPSVYPLSVPIAFPYSIAVLKNSQWTGIPESLVYTTASGIGLAGNSQDANLPLEAMVVGGSEPVPLAADVPLWIGTPPSVPPNVTLQFTLKVMDNDTGIPIPASVLWNGTEAMTDSQGQLTIVTNSLQGSLVVSAPGYQPLNDKNFIAVSGQTYLIYLSRITVVSPPLEIAPELLFGAAVVLIASVAAVYVLNYGV